MAIKAEIILYQTMRLALYQPEIPQNTGTLLRLSACLGISVDIIEPCGFVWHHAHLRRAALDYRDMASVQRHASWENFQRFSQSNKHRLVLLDITASIPYISFRFTLQDIVLVGKESSGVPKEIKGTIPHSVKIPMLPKQRSLNMAIAAAMVLGEGLRQLGKFPML